MLLKRLQSLQRDSSLLHQLELNLVFRTNFFYAISVCTSIALMPFI